MSKKKRLLANDFLSQFTSYEELDSFLKQLPNRGIEKLLEGELNHHLGNKEQEWQLSKWND